MLSLWGGLNCKARLVSFTCFLFFFRMLMRIIWLVFLASLVCGQLPPGPPEAFPRQDPSGFPMDNSPNQPFLTNPFGGPLLPNQPLLPPNQFSPPNQPFDPNAPQLPGLPWDRPFEANPYESNIIINEAWVYAAKFKPITSWAALSKTLFFCRFYKVEILMMNDWKGLWDATRCPWGVNILISISTRPQRFPHKPLFLLHSSTYFIVASKVVRPGQLYRVAVTVLQASKSITVRANIQRNGVEVSADHKVVKPGIPESLLMKVKVSIILWLICSLCHKLFKFWLLTLSKWRIVTHMSCLPVRCRRQACRETTDFVWRASL